MAKHPEQVRDAFRWMVYVQGNVEGCDLREMSLDYFLDDKGKSANDYLPEGGYSSIVDALFKRCKTEVKFEHRVRKIVYSGNGEEREEGIKVITNKGEFNCKYLISSLPLGVLQEEAV